MKKVKEGEIQRVAEMYERMPASLKRQLEEIITSGRNREFYEGIMWMANQAIAMSEVLPDNKEREGYRQAVNDVAGRAAKVAMESWPREIEEK